MTTEIKKDENDKSEKKSYGKFAFRGISWNFIFLMLAAPIGYFVRIVYARQIPKLEVGLFYSLFDFCCIIALFKDLGLSQALVHFIPGFLHKHNFYKVKSVIVTAGFSQICVSLFFTVIIITISPFIAYYYINNTREFTQCIPLVIKTLIILSIGYWFQSIVDVISNTILGFQYQRCYPLINFTKISLILLLSLLGIYLLDIHSIYVPVLVYTLVPIILIIVFGTIFVKYVFPDFLKLKYIYSKKLLKQIFAFGLPVTIGTGGGILLGYTDSICLTYFKGMNAVADYKNVAMPTVSILGYLSSSIAAVFFPMSAELWEKKRIDLLVKNLKTTSLYLFIIVLPLSIFTAYFAKDIVIFFFPRRYLSAAPAITILSVGIIFMALTNVGYSVINGIGKPMISTKIMYIGAAINLIFNLILIPRLGVIGAATGTSIGYLAMWIVQNRILKKIFAYSLPIKKWLLTVLSGLLSLAAVYIFYNLFKNPALKVFISLSMGCTLYLLLLIFFKIITLNEVNIKQR